MIQLAIRIVLSFALMLSSFMSLAAQSNAREATHLLESGKAEKLTPPQPSKELTIVSYNIRWRSGDELQQIIRWLKETAGSRPAIIGLQEVDRARKRSRGVNHAKAIADSLGMYYAWAAPHATKSEEREEETGVAIFSSYPLTQVTRIVLPHPGPGGRLRVAMGATAQVGNTPVRIYSVHSETRVSIAKKVEQQRAVLDDLAKYPKAITAIVVGDFNAWEDPARDGIRKLFTNAGFMTPLPDDESTFYRKLLMFPLKLKLDWIWVRGLTPQSYGIDRKLKVSDHFPLWTVVKLPETRAAENRAVGQRR